MEQLSWTDDMMLRAEKPETPMQIQMLLIYDGTGTFHSDLLISGETVDGPPLASFDGRWMVSDGLIITAIAVH